MLFCFYYSAHIYLLSSGKHYLYLQTLCISHLSHFGLRAVQISLPNITILWQKSDCSLFGINLSSSRSVVSGSGFVVRPRRWVIRIQWVSATTETIDIASYDVCDLSTYAAERQQVFHFFRDFAVVCIADTLCTSAEVFRF